MNDSSAPQLDHGIGIITYSHGAKKEKNSLDEHGRHLV